MTLLTTELPTRPIAGLQPSARMPVLFLGHGSPMHAIEDSVFRRGWESMGETLRARMPRPQLILCISAHWTTQGGWSLTGMEHPRTIHDFRGFPEALYAIQYPAPGAPEIAQALAYQLTAQMQAMGLPQGVQVDAEEWGLDHGSWSVLRSLFPQADVPVIQLSMDYAQPPAVHFALGQQLRTLRDQGVLVVGSGSIVHNLRALFMRAPGEPPSDWELAFDARVASCLRSGELEALTHFLDWGPIARMAHPTHEHLLPLLYAAGAVHAGEAVHFFNDDQRQVSASMRSAIWGLESD